MSAATATRRIIPQQAEPDRVLLTEQCVLGGLLIDNASFDRIADALTADDFYRREHRLIFSAIATLCQESHQADVVTISEYLEKRGDIENVGGLAYLGTLANNTPSAANIVAYAKIVREASVRREVTRTLESSAKAVRDGGVLGELTDAVIDRLRNISERMAPDRSSSIMLRMADVQPEPIRWLWPSRIALGKLTLLVGDPGLGKSFVTLDLAARVSTGSPWPDSTPAPKGSVILLSAEDDPADTIRPRLDALGANSERIHVLQAVREQGDGGFVERTPRLGDLAALAEAIERIGDVRLLIVDPIAAYLGGDVDSHKNSDIRALLAPLATVAARYGVAVVGVSHLNKSQGSAIYRTMGSLAFVAAARAAWCVTKDPDDEHRRLVLPVKNNIGPDQGGLAYRIEDDRGQARIVWERDPVHANVNDILGANTPAAEDRTKRDDAAEWLRELLADGPLSAKDVERQVKQAGLSWATIRRAKDSLGVKTAKTRFDGGWEWALPKKLNATSPKNVSTFGASEHLREFPEEKRASEGSQDAQGVEDAQDAQSGRLGHLRGDVEAF